VRFSASSNGERLAAKILTKQRTATYYISWFFRIHYSTESGWVNNTTPDGRPIIEQDAYFWQSMEVIGRTLNRMATEEMQKISAKGR
jgi:hypothetical protein